MQVTQQDDHVTHTVIGGKQTIDFGISNSAEFFQILSSTLYKDQKLAVIRETLCNAWDAHIVAGRTNVPIEVTIANNQIVIKDFGLGILDADMGPIYGVYGASTKQNDGKQTGGFGLGCKAPFAYTEHFQVISCHKGIKTIYAISKSSSTVGGKPGITPIVSMPTDDTGLTITIQLRESNDAAIFTNHLKKIVLNGDIFCTLNGEVLPRIGMSMTPNTFAFTTSLDIRESRLYVRYGNVIYPIEHHRDYDMLYRNTAKFAEKISNHAEGYFSLLFQAAPHTISVTPSRESISMQEHTIKTITRLLQNFLNQYNEKTLAATRLKCVDEFYVSVEEDDINVNDYLSSELRVHFFFEQTKNTRTLTTIEEYVRYSLTLNYPRDFAFRYYDLTHRLNLLIKHGKIDSNFARSFLQFFKRTDPKNFEMYAQESNSYHLRQKNLTVNEWFFKSYAKKIITRFNEQFNLDRLYVSDSRVGNTFNHYDNTTSRYFYKDTNLTQIRAVRFFHMNDMLAYLRNVVVLGTSRNIFKVRAPSADVLTGSGFLFHHVGMKKDEIEKARAFWAKSGMTVIDLCDERVTEPSYKPKEKKEKKPGYVAVEAAWINEHISLRNYHADNVQRIENPEFYVRVKLRQDRMHAVNGFDRHTEWYMKRFGHLGALVHTDKQVETLKKKGIPDFNEYITKWFINTILRNERIIHSQKFDSNRIMELSEKGINSKIVLLVLGNPGLKKHFKLERTITTEDKELLVMLQRTRDNFPLTQLERGMLKELVRTLHSVPLDPTCEVFVKEIENSLTISFLDTAEFDERYKETEDPIVHQQLVQLFTTILYL